MHLESTLEEICISQYDSNDLSNPPQDVQFQWFINLLMINLAFPHATSDHPTFARFSPNASFSLRTTPLVHHFQQTSTPHDTTTPPHPPTMAQFPSISPSNLERTVTHSDTHPQLLHRNPSNPRSQNAFAGKPIKINFTSTVTVIQKVVD
jgi:hypothetical protein